MMKKNDVDKPKNGEEWFGYIIGLILSYSFIGIINLIRLCLTSIGWLTVAFFFSSAFKYGWMLSLFILIAPMIYSKTRPYSFVIWDIRRYQARKAKKLAVKRGNVFLREIGIINSQDEEVYKVMMRPNKIGCEFLFTPINGISPKDIIDRCEAYKSQLNAKRLLIKDQGNGNLSINFVINDPLDEVITITEPKTEGLNFESMTVPCGVDDEGEIFKLSFKNTSGFLIGGTAGSGKSAGISSTLPALASSEHCSLTVIDGKGGDDLSHYRFVADRFIAVENDLTEVEQLLSDTVQEMQRRIKTNKELLGESNFWNASLEARKKAGLPFKIILIDECQFLLDVSMIVDKEEKNIRLSITRHIMDLIKRGRSAGIMVILATQKTDATAISSGIRDVMNLRCCLRVSNKINEQMVLGTLSDDPTAPSAVNIPKSRAGGAICASEDGTLKNIRFFYFPENDLAKYLAGQKS